MKIKNTDLEIIKGDIVSLSVDAIVVPNPRKSQNTKARWIIPAMIADKNRKVDQGSLRQGISNAFQSVLEFKCDSVAFSSMAVDKNFPIIGTAKILAQEILKTARLGKNPPKKIIICLEDAVTFKTFDTTIRGYVTHIQDDLGQGPYVTVDIIIELPEGIILIERSNPPYGWALPGGFVDYGESLEISARREAKEETNMELEDLRQFHTYSAPTRDPRFHTISTVFVAKGKGKPQFGDDAKGLKVIPYSELLKRDYAFDHKQVITDYLASRKK